METVEPWSSAAASLSLGRFWLLPFLNSQMPLLARWKTLNESFSELSSVPKLLP